MANLGPRDTSHLVMMTGWDATELQKFELADGTTYAEIVAQLNAALAALNAEFANDWMAGLYSVSERPDIKYRVGSSNGYDDHTEYALPDIKRAAVEGHMLPLKAYDRMLGWTWDFLRDAYREDVEADIADAIKDSRAKRRVAILTRCLKRGDDSGSNNGLGSSGYSPGFATAAASTSVDFDPPDYGGVSFDSDHEHCVGIAGGAFTNAVFSDAKSELREHGHEPPYEFIIGPSDETTVRGLSDFTPVAENLVAYGATQDVAKLAVGEDGIGSYYIGTAHDFAIRVVAGMPQYYGFGYKSYGRLSQRNPLRIRLHKGVRSFIVQAFPHPAMAHNPMCPIQNLMTWMEFGVGVADRTAGTPRYTNSTVWADGTAT